MYTRYASTLVDLFSLRPEELFQLLKTRKKLVAFKKADDVYTIVSPNSYKVIFIIFNFLISIFYQSIIFRVLFSFQYI